MAERVLTLKALREWVPAEGRVALVIGPHVWGKGKSGAEALRNAKSQGVPRVKEPKFRLIDAPEGAYVDDMGDLCYKNDVPAPIVLGDWTPRPRA